MPRDALTLPLSQRERELRVFHLGIGLGTHSGVSKLADSSFVYPDEKWARVNGLDMRYLDWGGDGEPLLALHGLASSAHWYDIVSASSPRTSGATARPLRRAQATTGTPCPTTLWRCWTM